MRKCADSGEAIDHSLERVWVSRKMNGTQGSDGVYGESEAGLQPVVPGAHHHQSRSPRAQLVHQHSDILLTQLQVQGGVPRAGEKAKVGRIAFAFWLSHFNYKGVGTEKIHITVWEMEVRLAGVRCVQD